MCAVVLEDAGKRRSASRIRAVGIVLLTGMLACMAVVAARDSMLSRRYLLSEAAEESQLARQELAASLTARATQMLPVDMRKIAAELSGSALQTSSLAIDCSKKANYVSEYCPQKHITLLFDFRDCNHFCSCASACDD